MSQSQGHRRSKSRSSSRKFARPEWLSSKVWVALAVGALFGGAAVAQNLAERTRSTGLAGRAFTGPGTALKASVDGFQRTAKIRKPAQTLAAARESIVLSPLHVQALILGGMAYEASHKDAQARAAMVAAEKLSRREEGLEIWWVNRAIKDETPVLALKHIDNILRTDGNSAQELQTRLTRFINVPEGRDALVPFINRNPPWLDSFLFISAQNTKPAEHLGLLLLKTNNLPSSESADASIGHLLRRMADEGSYATMWRLYDRVQPSVRSAASTFSLPHGSDAKDRSFPPIDWHLEGTPDFGASLENDADGMILTGFAMPNYRGTVAAKIARLRAGRYELQWATSIPAPSAGGAARLELACENRQPFTQSQNLLESPQSNGAEGAWRQFKLDFSVPTNCAAVVLRISMVGGRSEAPTEVRLKNVSLKAL